MLGAGAMDDAVGQREELRRDLARRGVSDERVLDAMARVPREAFVPADLRGRAYADGPLPIGRGQTISQPLVVALTAQALRLRATDRVLEVGAGSGYAAAVLAELAAEVFTIDRLPDLADAARERLRETGYGRVEVRHGDGTLGLPQAAPFDAIAVAAGGPEVPAALREQLTIGGRLVIPVGQRDRGQRLVRVTRVAHDQYEEEDLGPVSFVPLVGRQGWRDDGRPPVEIVRDAAEPFASIDSCDFGPLLDRIGDSRVVLVGEATHGTHEFYRWRAELTRRLVEERGFDVVAVEADWPDAARINGYVTHRGARPGPRWAAFTRWPTWMWRNRETLDFIEWLREFNLSERPDPTRRCGFYGLDLYNLSASIRLVLDYLDGVDPQTAAAARERYGCLTPFQDDPAAYGHAALTGRYRECEGDVVAMLRDLLDKQAEYAANDGERFLDAALNAKLVADAERYYRVMYHGGRESWNHRDTHMSETLQQLLTFRGPASRAVVWAHNSHLGDAAATEMSARGETNLGRLCRERFGRGAYLIGQLTHAGTVAAGASWDAPMEVMDVVPGRQDSHERLLHDAGPAKFLLPLRGIGGLEGPRLERAIGVVYRPQTERASHYFEATLPRQFDEIVWFDRTRALEAIHPDEAERHPPHHPFAAVD